MKLRNLNILTKYPRGYAGTDPRLIVGDAEIQYGPDTYHYATHEISKLAMQKIADIVIADYQSQLTHREIPGSVVFDEADLPPAPEPEPLPEPEAPTAKDDDQPI